MDLFDRLEKTANEALLTDETTAQEQEVLSQGRAEETNNPNLASRYALNGALAGGAIGTLSGGLHGAIVNPKRPLVGGMFNAGINGLSSAAVGAGIGSIAGAITQNRQGARSVSDAPAGMDQTAEELIERLEKSASVISSAVKGTKNFANKVSGKEYRLAKKQYDVQGATPYAMVKANQNGVPVSKFRQNLEGLESKAIKAKSDTSKARKQLGIGVGATAVAGGTAAAIGGGKDDDQFKTASDLINNLEKTAGKYIDNLLGKSKKNWEGHLTNAKNGKDGVVQLESVKGAKAKVDAAKKEQAKAIGATVAGVGATGALIGGATVASKKGKEEQEKEASENEEFMNGLYKEAAAKILEEMPVVNGYTDPMDRIKFTK